MSDETRDAILVTGAAGFIGSHVVDALLDRGERVVGVDNFDPLLYSPEHKRRNVAACLAHRNGGKYAFQEMDFTDAGALRALLARTRCAGVIHLGAKAGVRPSLKDPASYMHTNVTGTAVVLAEATRAGCRRAIIASSSSVYGNAPTAPFREDMDVSEPISPYAASKKACELLAHSHTRTTGLPTGCLRFFTVFGPRQRPDLAIRTFFSLISAGKAIPVFGDGSSSRDYTYIGDIVAGVLAAYDRVDGFRHRVWNLGGNEAVTLSEMIRSISAVVGREAVIDRRPPQPGDVERTSADLTRVSAELGYRPATTFLEGLKRQWAWMREQPDAPLLPGVKELK